MTGPFAHRHLICEELPARVDCWSVAGSLGDERFLFMLDSAGRPSELGRYSILAWDPRWEFLAKDGVARAGPPGQAQALAGRVLAQLDQTLAAFAAAASRPAARGRATPPPVFTGGAVGFLAYELLHEIESVPRSAAPDLGVQDCHLLFCDSGLITDEVSGRSWLLSNGWGSTARDSRADAAARFEAARTSCDEAQPRPERAGPERFDAFQPLRYGALDAAGVQAMTDPARYLELVAVAREHILAGDVYELCLTQAFTARLDVPGIELYETMRGVNPAPMGAYLRFSDLELLSCSPERFLRLGADRRVQTRPIKGTRPRGRTPLEDQALAIDLATAPKDAAEHVMIVDVARNDLGRVCDFGSVCVPVLKTVERHPSVLQLVSTIEGRLHDGVTPVQLLRATFPGGSMTGAPKIEAMRLISRMEQSRRGVYSGAVGYITYSGELDLSMVIRSVVKRGDALTFHTGGAITADSVPEDEYQETLDKAHALVRALELARGVGRASAAA